MSGAENMPVLLPPPVQINDEHKRYDVAAWCVVMCVVASSTVLLRLFVRLRDHTFMLDDYAAALSLLAYIAWSGLAIWANLNTGVGKPLWEVTIAEYELWFRTIAACSFLYPVMTTTIRVTILLFYKRLFSRHDGFNRVVNILLGLQAAYLVVFTITPGFVCTPLYASWTLELYGTHCNMPYYGATTMALYGTSLGLDFIITVIPLWPISQLQLPTKKKLGVATLFMLGFIATAATAVKLGFWVFELDRPWTGDPIWLTYQLSMFIPSGLRNYAETFWVPSQLEPTVALICASVPALAKVARSFGTRLASIVSSKRTTTGPPTMGKSARSDNKGYIRQGSYKRSNSVTEMYGDEVQLNNMSASGGADEDGRR